MKRRYLFILICCIALTFVLYSISKLQKNSEKFTSQNKTSFDHFGTVSSVLVYDDSKSLSAKNKFESVNKEIDDMLTELEGKISVDVVDSDIYKFNQAKYNESVAISPVTAKVVKMAIDMHKFTKGAYNPAVANLVDLWGFSPRFLNNENKMMPYDRVRNKDGSFNLPDKRYIEAFKALSDFSGVILSGNETSGYYLTKKVKDIEVDGIVYSLKIDLGGIGKGYAADMAAEIMKKHGYEYGLVSIGLSSIKLLKRNVSNEGAKGDNMWAISMSNPNNRSEDYLTTFGKNVGVSTSGTYDLHYYLNEREYSHIIDPNTGEPTTSNIVSVSISGGDASYDDALTTALCVMGKEKATEFMNTYLKDYKVAFLVRNGDKLQLVTNMADGEYILNK